MPLAVAFLGALAAVAALGLVLEFTIWAPMRRRGAGVMQLLLLSIGLAFVLRNLILFEWGGDDRTLDVDQFQVVEPLRRRHDHGHPGDGDRHGRGGARAGRDHAAGRR